MVASQSMRWANNRILPTVVCDYLLIKLKTASFVSGFVPASRCHVHVTSILVNINTETKDNHLVSLSLYLPAKTAIQLKHYILQKKFGCKGFTLFML